MSGLHARTPETDRLCLAWAETHDPGDGNGPLGKPETWDEVTKDVVLDAFAAGMAYRAPGDEVVEALRQSFEGSAPDGLVDAAISLSTGDPRFDPRRALLVNGFGFVPAPVVITALKYPLGDVRNDTGGRTAPSYADPSHDCSELPRPCVIIEPTVDGLFPGDEGYRRAEAARTSTD